MTYQSRRGPAGSPRGFSLIEILVVIVLIGLLASIVAPNMMGKIGGAKTKTARLQIEDLAAAVDLYFLDVGAYPTSEQGLGVLLVAPENASGWDGPYLRKSKLPLDPWNNAYQYRAPGEHGPFDVWSTGADGRAGGEDENADIVGWE